MRRLILGLAVSLAGISNILKIVAGLALHVFVTYVAYNVSGTLAAILTFLLPPFSEVFWIIKIWNETGVFWSLVTIGSALYVLLWIVIMIFMGIAAAASE